MLAMAWSCTKKPALWHVLCVLHMYRWFRASGAASFFARMLTAYAASRTTRLNAATWLNPWDYHMTVVVFVMRIGHEPTWYGKAMYCSRNCLKLGVLRTCFWQAHLKVLEFVYMQPRDTVLLTPLFFDQKQGGKSIFPDLYRGTCNAGCRPASWSYMISLGEV